MITQNKKPAGFHLAGLLGAQLSPRAEYCNFLRIEVNTLFSEQHQQ